MANAYSPADMTLVDSFTRIHGNAEQTHVAILRVGEREHLAVATDVCPGDFAGLAAEPIAYGPTREDTVERAERWMQANPKGVAPGDGGGGGIGAKIWNALKALNDYGDTLLERQQQQQKNGGED